MYIEQQLSPLGAKQIFKRVAFRIPAYFFPSDCFTPLSVCMWSVLCGCLVKPPPRHKHERWQQHRWAERRTTTAGQKNMSLTLTAAWRCWTAGSRKPAESKRRSEEQKGERLNLPYKRCEGDISSPNLAEGTCLEASHTYRGKLCGRFPGWKQGCR